MKATRFLLTAVIASALALTLSCSNEGNNTPSQQQDKPSSNSGNTSNNTSGILQDYRNGKAYKWVKIDEQIWMAENINYAVEGSRCGGEIVISSSIDGKTKSYNLTDENTVNCDKYGRLYRWAAAMDSACPQGWHLPSDAEWDKLTDFVSEYLYSEEGAIIGSDAAIKLKANSDLWKESPDGWDGKDNYGFVALPGGYSDDGSFKSVGEAGFWWTSTNSTNANNAYNRNMWYALWNVSKLSGSKSNYYSVRCVKDS